MITQRTMKHTKPKTANGRIGGTLARVVFIERKVKASKPVISMKLNTANLIILYTSKKM